MESASRGKSAADARQLWVDRLFRRYGKRLLAFLSLQLRNRSEASELAQEVWARLLDVEDPNAIRSPEAYLFTIARHLASRHGQLEQRARNAADLDDPAVQEELAEVPPFDEGIDTGKRRERLAQVLRELPVKQRTAVVLRYWHELSYEEIAVRLKVSTNMVKKYLKRALLLCRRRMARLD